MTSARMIEVEARLAQALEERDAPIVVGPEGGRLTRRLNGRVRYWRMVAARMRGDHSHEEWIALLQEFEHRCVCCGGLCDPEPTKDHIIAVSMGGSDSIENIQPLCRECNTTKGGGGADWKQHRRGNGWGDCG